MFLHTGDAAGLRRQEAGRDRDHVGVVEQQRRQLRAWLEAVAAGRAAESDDAVPERPQPFDVVAHGTRADTKPFGKLGATPCSPHLEQREQIEETFGSSCHAAENARSLGTEHA